MSPLKLTIYLIDDEKDLLAANPFLQGRSVLGFYSPDIEQIYAVSGSLENTARQRNMPRNVRADDARTVLFHEYAHHYVHANNRVAYPSWYHEGFAEFLSTAEFRSGGVDIGKFTMNRAYWLQQRDWMPLQMLLSSRPMELTSEQNALFYAQAWLLTHMLFVRRERAQGFDRYVRALQQGGDPLKLVEESFGVSVEQLDRELQTYKTSSIAFWRMDGMALDAPEITIQRLSPAADALLLPGVFLRSRPGPEAAAGALAAVRTTVKQHANDAYALRIAAMAEVWHGDNTEARRLVDQALAIDANNAEAHHLSGLCHLRAGRANDDNGLFEQASEAFLKAHALDGTRASSIFRYVEAEMHLDVFDNSLVDALVSACNLAPQVGAIAATTASALMLNERFAEAATVLRPIAANPHGGEFAAKARELLDQAAAEDSARFTFFGYAYFPDDQRFVVPE